MHTVCLLLWPCVFSSILGVYFNLYLFPLLAATASTGVSKKYTFWNIMKRFKRRHSGLLKHSLHEYYVYFCQQERHRMCPDDFSVRLPTLKLMRPLGSDRGDESLLPVDCIHHKVASYSEGDCCVKSNFSVLLSTATCPCRILSSPDRNCFDILGCNFRL